MEQVLQQFLTQMQELAPEVLDGLVAMQRAEFALISRWWWFFGLLTFAMGALFYFAIHQYNSDWDFLIIGSFGLGLIFLVIFVVMICILIFSKPIFDASPEIYVLKDLLNK